MRGKLDKVVGLQLKINKKIEFKPESIVSIEKNKVIVEGQDTEDEEYRVTSVRYFITGIADSTRISDNTRLVTPSKYRDVSKQLRGLIDYRLYSARLTDGRSYVFKSGTVDYDNRTINGKLWSGQSVTVSADSLRSLKFKKADLTGSILLGVAIAAGIAGILVYEAFKDLRDWGNSSRR